jgi:cytochrome c
MDSMEVNKAVAAVLAAGIAFMVAGMVADGLVNVTPLQQTAIKVDTSKLDAGAAPAAAAEAAKPMAPIGSLLLAADPAKGEAFAKKVCAACHTFTDGGHAGVGPNLYNVVGGPHAHMQGYGYSDAMKKIAATGSNWSYDELNKWLVSPQAYAPGTKMSYAGIKDDGTRADVIAYLRSLSPSPLPLPAAAGK